jgi:hypothetical protein
MIATTCFAMLAAMVAPSADVAAPPAITDGQSGTRIILHYDGRQRLCGLLLQQDENGVTMTDEDGDRHTIDAHRVIGIEPLLTLPVPTEGVVRLIDGREFRGLLRRDDCDAVELLMHDVPLEIKRDRVSAVWLLEPVEKRYQSLKELMPVTRPAAHLALCEWLVSEQAWGLAITELKAHVAAHRSPEAARLLRVARAQQDLAQRATKSSGDSPAKAEPAGPTPVDDAAVNLIRVYEIDFDNPPPIRISADVRRAFVASYGTSALLPQDEAGRNALIDGEAIEILKLMFAHRAREFYAQVEVQAEPAALRQFRQAVHDTWLVPRCGMRACHGGPDAGRFRLLRANRFTDRIRTSNLLILDELELDGLPMIDWREPMQSTLIQYALPRNLADRPHPPVAAWKPTLESPDAHRTRLTVKWIESMLREPRPDYPVQAPVQLPPAARSTPRAPR